MKSGSCELISVAASVSEWTNFHSLTLAATLAEVNLRGRNA
jgi:hypothetical protein